MALVDLFSIHAKIERSGFWPRAAALGGFMLAGAAVAALLLAPSPRLSGVIAALVVGLGAYGWACLLAGRLRDAGRRPAWALATFLPPLAAAVLACTLAPAIADGLWSTDPDPDLGELGDAIVFCGLLLALAGLAWTAAVIWIGRLPARAQART